MPDTRGPAAEELGRRVRRLRLERRLSQEKLGYAAGLHPTHIGHIERAVRDARFSTLLQVAEALEVDIGELVAGIRRGRTGPTRHAKNR